MSFYYIHEILFYMCSVIQNLTYFRNGSKHWLNVNCFVHTFAFHLTMLYVRDIVLLKFWRELVASPTTQLIP